MSTASSKLDAQDAIDYSYNLLVERGFERAELGYETSDFTIVQFPSGEQGVFVTIGIFMGVDHGYQLLYRIENGQFELIEPIRTGRYVWGLKSTQNEKQASAQVDMEFLDIPAQSSEWENIVKVTGAGHPGTGAWYDGYFEILAITDNGLQELFAGFEFITNSTNYDRYYEYQFADLDGDGNQEIVEVIENCEYQINPDTWKREDLGCRQSQQVYQFNGTRYVPE
ncbi:MAG: hypothetical protein GY832_32570 [Chloroflexi bacterium]|nr:hypothetical protein [Chloroflexota bacterium]